MSSWKLDDGDHEAEVLKGNQKVSKQSIYINTYILDN